MVFDVRLRARVRAMLLLLVVAATPSVARGQAVPIGVCHDLPVRLDRGAAVPLTKAIVVRPADWRASEPRAILATLDEAMSMRPGDGARLGTPERPVAAYGGIVAGAVFEPLADDQLPRAPMRPERTWQPPIPDGHDRPGRPDVGIDVAARSASYVQRRDEIASADGSPIVQARLSTPRGTPLTVSWLDDGAEAIGAPLPDGATTACTATVAGTSLRVVTFERVIGSQRRLVHQVVARPPGDATGATVFTGAGLTDDEVRTVIAMALGTLALERQ